MMIDLHRLDHLVLTVADIQATCDFYSSVLGCQTVRFSGADGATRVALKIGDSPQKINLHASAQPLSPAANVPQPGSADLCFITSTPLETVLDHLRSHQISVIEGPIERTGTLGPILSVYIRDPDGNLIEVANSLSPSE